MGRNEKVLSRPSEKLHLAANAARADKAKKASGTGQREICVTMEALCRKLKRRIKVGAVDGKPGHTFRSGHRYP